MKRATAAGLAVLWLAAGLYGVQSYGSHYYNYRGFPPPHDPPGVAAGHVQQVKFFSRALGKERTYLAYMPAHYGAMSAAGRRFPVLYVLHGSPGYPVLFLNAGHLGVAFDTLLARGRIARMLLVMPDGRDGTFRSDTEWANSPHGRWEDYVLDVVHDVDARFATRPDRLHRGLAGNSEGAFAAVNVALHNLGTFAVAEAWSGYFSAEAKGPFKHATVAEIARNSPATYVPSMAAELRRRPLYAYLYVGADEPTREQARRFAQELAAAGAHVTFPVFRGRHSWNLWHREMSRSLVYADQRFRGLP
jgi:enterochelin esterase-like enzyme